MLPVRLDALARALAGPRDRRGLLQAVGLAPFIDVMTCPSGVVCDGECCPAHPGDSPVCTSDGCCRRSERCPSALGYSLCCASGEACRRNRRVAGWVDGGWCCAETKRGTSCRG